MAILVVIFGSSDRIEPWPKTYETIARDRGEAPMVARRTDGLRWAVPKSDKLQMTSGAQTTRFIIHDTQKVKKANREYIYAKPYIRIVSRLAEVPRDYADVIPPFNPFKLYATERQADVRTAGAEQAGSDVNVKVVELLGGILPGDDGLELDAQEVSEIVGRSIADVATSDPSTNTADLQAGATSGGLAALNDNGTKRRLSEEPAAINTTTIAKHRADHDADPASDLEGKQVRVIKAGRAETLVRILQQAGADIWTARAMAEAAKQVWPDPTLAVGHEARITMVPSLTVQGRQEPARVSVFTEGQDHKVTVSRNSAGDFIASATAFDEKDAIEMADGEAAQLSSLYASLYAAALIQNVAPDTIQQMLRVHAYETDFRRRVRSGDTIEMFFDSRDESASDTALGDLLFTAIATGGQGGRFWRFRTPDGTVDYYDEHGNNAKRFLLRKPLRSDDVRLTSGFGMRFHPLFNERRMHAGIDWSGPIGTPIVAAGNGVVEEALYKGGHGKYVRVRHANGYQTTYSHMSGFARGIEAATRVRQGQIIGFLGNTGYSTGPHLHFEILVNNRFVDPLSIQVPRERQLAGKQLAEFFREKSRIDDLMRRPPVMMQSK